ncbi:MAG TPA: P83/100 family protein [Spirochaetia bacterium]|nr:P83/100 family protein [Spirochaetia bacterium]
MRRTILSLFLMMICTAAFAQDVNKAELESVANQRIQFLNYEGPPTKIETIQEIRSIGTYLGQGLDLAHPMRDYFGKYRIIHAVDPSTSQKLDADILVLEQGAEVDHIDNLRIIIQGFLQAAYGYNDADSKLLAYFVTIYNAVHRGNMIFVAEKYKPIVTKNVSADNVGLSVRYNEWPGKTRMIIPLGAAALGSLGSLSPTELVGPQVIDELRTRQDMGIAQRKEMVGLIERIIQQKEQQLSQLQSAPQTAAAPGTGPGTAQSTTAPAAQTSTTTTPGTAPAAASAAVASAPQSTQPAAQPSPGGTQPPPAASTQSAPARQPAAGTQPAQTAAENQAAIAQTQKQIQQLQDTARQQREQIARDQQQLLNKAPEQPKTAASAQNLLPVTFLMVNSVSITIDSTGTQQGVMLPFAQVVKINPLTFEPVQTSPIKAVVGRYLLLIGKDELPVIIALKSSLPASAASSTSVQTPASSDPVLTSAQSGRLVQLDPKTLDPATIGTDVIFPGSVLEEHGGELYAVVRDSGAWHLGRFNPDLTLIERSAVDVNPFTTLAFRGDRVWIQTSDNRVVPLLIQDLRVAH